MSDDGVSSVDVLSDEDERNPRKSVRLPKAMIDSLEEAVEKGRFINWSEAVRYCVGLGLKDLKAEGILA